MFVQPQSRHADLQLVLTLGRADETSDIPQFESHLLGHGLLPLRLLPDRRLARGGAHLGIPPTAPELGQHPDQVAVAQVDEHVLRVALQGTQPLRHVLAAEQVDRRRVEAEDVRQRRFVQDGGEERWVAQDVATTAVHAPGGFSTVAVLVRVSDARQYGRDQEAGLEKGALAPSQDG